MGATTAARPPEITPSPRGRGKRGARGRVRRGTSGGGRPESSELAHDELQKKQGSFGGLLVFGEVAEDAALFFAAERRVGHDDIDAVFVADLAEGEAQAVQGIDPGRFQAGQNQIHLGEQIGKRLGLAAEDALTLERLPVFDRFALFLQMLEGLDEKSTGAAGWVEDHLAELGIDDLHHEADDGTRGVEFAGIAGVVVHLLQYRFVEMAEGVDFVAAGEVDVIDLVDHVAEQVAVDHAVDRAFEDRGDDVAPVAAL